MPTAPDYNSMCCMDAWGKMLRSSLECISMHLKECNIKKAEKVWNRLIWHAKKEQKTREKEDAGL